MTLKTRLPTVQPQTYGDLTELNTCRLVMDAVGKEVLADIMGDFLDLLESSAVVYEANGDYAQGIFTSGWCRKMDEASRNLCGTDDNQVALASGKWLCHESCWYASKSSMETNAPADLPCQGGIRIHAVPIRVHGQVVGSINLGYGDPPQDPQKQREIAAKYGLPVEELQKQAAAYKSRDPFLNEVAKSRVATVAKLIGVMIERKQAAQQLEYAQADLEKRVQERTAELEKANQELQAEITGRKRAEEDLRQSEGRIRAVVDHVISGIITINEQGVVDSLNPAAERIFGYRASEVIEHNVKMLMPEPFCSEHDTYLANFLRTGKAKVIGIGREVIGRRKDGSTFPMELGVSEFRINSHRFFTGIVQDVTERKQAEQRLVERTGELEVARRLAAEHTITAILAEFPSLEEAVPRIIHVICETLAWVVGTVWKVDPNGQVLRCVETYQAGADIAKEFEALTRQITFASGIGLPGRIWASGKPSWIPDVTKDTNFPRSKVAAQEGLHGAFGFPIILRGNVVGVIEFFSHEIQEPDREILSMMASVGSQISQAIEGNRIDEAFRASEARYRQIVETATEGIWTVDADNTTTFVNERMVHMLGYTAEEMMGRPLLSLLHERDRRQALERLERTRQGADDHFDVVLHRKDGTELATMVSATPLLGNDGRYAGALAMITDISERKKLEEQFRQSQKMEAFGQLAGGVAHDFNNLLTIILGYSDLLLSTGHLDDSAQNKITEIHEAGERAASLTRQLLAFSRKQVLEPKVLNLNAIITNTEKMLSRLIGEDITLTAILQPDLERVKVDPGQIEQVIINMAVNARDAMPQGGRLAIETANVELDQAYAERHPEVTPGCYVLIAVSDTGCGLDDAIKVRIFEPFFTTKGPGKGTGLGLATVYGIIKQSGGYIFVDSELGRGTTFKLYLPVARGKISLGKSSQGNKTSKGNETILLVEDEDGVRSVARYALKMFGYTVLEASNGTEALKKCEEHEGPIHLVVSDVVMPEMGGRRLIERLTTLRPDIKVLFFSGYTDDAVMRHGVLEAEVAFLQKPFTPIALANKVREVLDQ